MNILLSGAPFSGKTTIGAALAQKLNIPLINTDTLLEQKFNTTCSELYKLWGDQGFRECEKKVLLELLEARRPGVISLGGGTLTCTHNALLAKKLGQIVYLECSPEELTRRLKESGRTPAYLRGSFKELLDKREPHYRQHADLVLDVTDKAPEDAAAHIHSLLS